MKHSKTILAALATVALAGCASVPRDAGADDVQRAIKERGSPPIEWRAQPATADDERIAALLQGELTAEEAVAVAMLNNPRLQATLAELGIARADLIEASTITDPIFELEIRYPGEPYHPYELRLAQTLIELLQLPRRRALGRTAFDAAQMRVSSEVLRFGAEVRSAYYDLLAATQHVALTTPATGPSTATRPTT